MGLVIRARDETCWVPWNSCTATWGMRRAPWRSSVSALHAAELAGTQNVAGIWEGGGDADGAGLRVHLAIDEGDAAFQGIGFAVGEGQREGNGGRS